MTYHKHVAKRADPSRAPAHKRRGAELCREIRRVFAEDFGVHGVRKVGRQMKREGFDIARCTVSHLVRQGSEGRRPRQERPHHDQRHLGAKPARSGEPHLQGAAAEHAPAQRPHLCRDPGVSRSESAWSGFVSVAFVVKPRGSPEIDAFARRIVGWRVSRLARADFVLDALEQALHQPQPFAGGELAHRSERRSQHVGIRHTERLAAAGIEPSVGSVGASCWFNNRRLLEPIGNIPPAEAEEAHHTPPEVMPAAA